MFQINTAARYDKAYLLSEAILSWAAIIEVSGFVLSGLLILGALVIASQEENISYHFFVPASIAVVALLVALFAFIIFVVLSAIAQVLRAVLDTAVNTAQSTRAAASAPDISGAFTNKA